MKITVDIPDTKYRLLKSRAASEGTTIKAMVLRGVDIVLSENTTSRQRTLKLPLIRSKDPATLELDSESIYNLIGFP